ncbi:MAG TPA: hypothetical protein VFU02_14170, partial [Polyangiaceae bacterium]|nr:hypothetical protein [Polyangiaceae bacterium]
NQCVPGMGCVPVDVTETPQLLANGALDSAGDAWLEASSNGYPLIVVEDASVAAHTPTRYAWLGGAPYELSELTQVVSVPEGTQSLTLTFYYYLSGFVYPYYDYNVMGAQLRATDGVTVLHEFQRLGNQDFNSDWVEFTGTVDATAWAGTDVQVYFWAAIGADYYWYYGYPYYTDYNVGNSNYRIDSTSLTATVCQ